MGFKTFTEYEVLIHEEASINYFPYLEFDAKNVVPKESDRITSDGFIKINSLKFQINTKINHTAICCNKDFS